MENRHKATDLCTWEEGRRGEGEMYGESKYGNYMFMCKIDA